MNGNGVREVLFYCVNPLLVLPKKAEKELRRSEKHLDGRHCKILRGAILSVSLAEAYGANLGVYFDGSERAGRMTAAEL